MVKLKATDIRHNIKPMMRTGCCVCVFSIKIIRAKLECAITFFLLNFDIACSSQFDGGLLELTRGVIAYDEYLHNHPYTFCCMLQWMPRWSHYCSVWFEARRSQLRLCSLISTSQSLFGPSWLSTNEIVTYWGVDIACKYLLFPERSETRSVFANTCIHASMRWNKRHRGQLGTVSILGRRTVGASNTDNTKQRCLVGTGIVLEKLTNLC